MADRSENIFDGSSLDLAPLSRLFEPPQPWEPGEAHFWDDPHIAKQMLAAHLDPSTSAASAVPDVIDASVEWIETRLDLSPGMALIDLGCGPGLYARRFAARGMDVTGVDISQNSIGYARSHDPASTYRRQNYLDLEDEGLFDAALLIYGDYCVLNDANRATLLTNVHRALKPNGWFVLDVSTQIHHAEHNSGNGWSVHPDGGFWKPTPHLALARYYSYPEHALALDQYSIVEADGTLSIYRNWYRYFNPETITTELVAGDFEVQDIHADLSGTPFAPDGSWIGLVTRKR